MGKRYQGGWGDRPACTALPYTPSATATSPGKKGQIHRFGRSAVSHHRQGPWAGQVQAGRAVAFSDFQGCTRGLYFIERPAMQSNSELVPPGHMSGHLCTKVHKTSVPLQQGLSWDDVGKGQTFSDSQGCTRGLGFIERPANQIVSWCPLGT